MIKRTAVKLIRLKDTGRIRALLLRRINDYFGDASVATSLAAAAAAIDEKRRRNRKKYFLILVYCGFFYCSDHLRIWLESIAAIQKIYSIFFYCAFSIAAAAAASWSGCRSHAAFAAEAVVLRCNRSVFIRSVQKDEKYIYFFSNEEISEIWTWNIQESISTSRHH